MTSPRLAFSVLLSVVVLAGCAALVDGRASRLEAVAEAATPPVGQFVEVNGGKVHALVMGSGPDVVLIHGAGGNLRDMTMGLAQDLAKTHRVIAFDRPGLGYSTGLGDAGNSPFVQADTLRDAARQLGVVRPIVLGHSYGGAVAMAWALRDPSTRGLVIVAGATMPYPGGLGPWYQITSSTLGGASIVPLITAFATQAQIDASVAGVFAPDAVPVGYADHIGARLTIRRGAARINGRQVMALKPYLVAMEPNYAKLTLPVEILHGTGDTTVPHDIHAVPLSKRLPNARLTLIDDAGHMLHHIHRGAVVAAVSRLSQRR